MQRDIKIIRDLAKKYAEIASKDIQEERRKLWRDHNSFIRTRPLVYARWFLAREQVITPQLECEDPFFRRHEGTLRFWIFHDSIEDDSIIEPWITQWATYRVSRDTLWGPKIGRIPSPEPYGSWMFDPPLKCLEDFSLLVEPHHVIDEEATARDVSRLQDAVGDIIEVNVSRAPIYGTNLAKHLSDLRGLEQMMWDMSDNPEWLDELVSFLSDGVQRTHDQAEAAGDWHLADGSNQAMCYSRELPDPQSNAPSVDRDQLWGYCNAQELTLVSPRMHDEFMLGYQRPIMEKFGLVAYGCCEDLTQKIDILREWPNLRRISVTPFADVRRCAEQIQQDYVISWRPNPAEMVCCGFDPDHIRKVIEDGVEAMKGCHFDICLKDVETVEHQPQRLRDWVRIARRVVDNHT